MSALKKYMAPLWIQYPHIRRGSIGWRMGYGEDYAMKLNSWELQMSEDESKEYTELFPAPIGWLGWYENKVYEFEPTYSKDWLSDNNDNDFIFFWGHRPRKDGRIGKSCFSQWWQGSFKEGHITFCCMEQYMMLHKAYIFGDKAIEQRILNESNPKTIKELGRQIKHFDEEVWNLNKYEIVIKGNYLKFVQDIELKEFLLGTGDHVIVEASPYDKIWGIGLGQDDVRINDVNLWEGENLLGFALMEVRDMIRNVYKNEDLLLDVE